MASGHASRKIWLPHRDATEAEIYNCYCISKVFARKALRSEKCLDGFGALVHYQSAITILEEKTIQSPLFNQFRGNVEVNIPGGVQLFLVQKDDEVGAISGPTTLQAIVVTKEESPYSLPECYIKVGSWTYQLVQSRTEIRKCVNELYMFPFVSETDLEANYKAFGIVISDDLSPVYRQQFERILDDYSIYTIGNYRVGVETPEVNLSKTVRYLPSSEEENFFHDEVGNSISKRIDLGTHVICGGLAKSAELASNLIRYSSNTLKNHTAPMKEPTQVNGTVEKTAELANNISSVGVRATDFLVDGFTRISKAATTKITPHLKSAALSATSGTCASNCEHSTLNGAIAVARSGAQGLSKVWTGLEEAGIVVAKAAQDATVDTVNHRCGPDAARVVSHATEAAMNLGKAVNNVQRIGVKMLVKQVAKDSGKEFLENYVEKAPCTSTCNHHHLP